jgi:8-oxo-dGTP pyrophosphatase MutT (NUDIX family)
MPRPASTVVVLRDGPADTIEVLLVRRNDKVAFMAGAFVFPGGRVDEGDRRPPPMPGGPSRYADTSWDDEWTFRIAAVRELREEAGLVVDAADLVPFAHWVTPEIEPRRYDTRFFLARMPERQDARVDDSEATELAWLAPRAAVDRCRAGDIMLPPPTWTTLMQLARFGSVGAARAWAAAKPIPRVQPGLHRDERTTMLTLPGDPLHPTVPGWDVPEETRFLLQEGKGWLPIRP